MATLRQKKEEKWAIRATSRAVKKNKANKIIEIKSYGQIISALKRIPLSVVYVIQCNNFFKIGFSCSGLGSRLDWLQMGNPYDLRVVFVILTPNNKLLERKLHEKFNSKRVRGEWFELTEKDLFELQEFSFKFFSANKKYAKNN